MNKKIGAIGEQLAVNYLKNKGYSILDCNYRTRLGEIDIIATINDRIVFIEVKTRSSSAFGTPSEAVNYKKQMTIRRVSQQYLLSNKLREDNLYLRFDVIEVRLIGKKYTMNHMENAF